MRILRAEIRNFRSIDCLEIDFDPRLTILVGKNDSGKSNLLLALYSFHSEYKYDQEDLPYGSRLRNEYTSLCTSPTQMVTISFKITAADILPTSNLTEYAKRDQTFDVTKFLNNKYHLNSEISLPTQKVGLEMFKEQLDQGKAKLDSMMQKHPEVPKWYETVYAPNYVGSGFDSVVYTIIERLIRGIPDNLEQDSDITDAMNTMVSRLEELGKLIRDPYVPRKVGDYVLDNMRYHFVYIGDPGSLQASTKVDNSNDLSSNQTLLKLLKLANLNINAYLTTQDDMVKLSLQVEANATLKKKLEPVLDILSIELITIDYRDGELKIFAQDRSGRLSKVDDKSDGFMSLLCLYVNLLYESEQTPSAVFLIDDPAVHLHPEWQKNLRALLEQFSEQHQVILATHSPFLIDLSRLDRVRLILRDERTGRTNMEGRFYISHFDALEPIRSALGIHLTDSLIVGSKTLIVEGAEDYYLIHGMSELCKRLGKNHLDFSEVFILADKGSSIPYFAAIASHIGPNCVVFLDADSGGREAKKQLVNKWDFKKAAILLPDLVKCDAAKTADLLAKESYNRILESYSNDKIKAAKEILRICHNEQEAEKLVGNESVDNFSLLFEKINNLLTSQRD